MDIIGGYFSDFLGIFPEFSALDLVVCDEGEFIVDLFNNFDLYELNREEDVDIIRDLTVEVISRYFELEENDVDFWRENRRFKTKNG